MAATWAAACVAAALGVAFLLAPPMGTDLSAQVARADFVRRFGLRPIDFRWYGGIDQFGYSLITPSLMSAVGARALGVVAAVVAAAGLASLLRRSGARAPLLGGVFLGVVLVGNLVSGRITFAVGAAFAAMSLASAVTSATQTAASAASAARRHARVAGVAALAVLTTVTSPVAGLFLGLAASAWLLAGLSWDRSRRGRLRPGTPLVECMAVGGGAALGLIPMMLFGASGTQPFSGASMRTNVALALAVVVLCPANLRVLRVGALLTVALLFFAFYVPTAIGSNALRLPMLFAMPIVVAYSRWRAWALTAALAGMFWWQSPVMINDITQAGAPETRAQFYQPLIAELDTLGPLGRIEVVPLRDHWEALYMANAAPLARGWLRQVDVARNPVFYGPTPMTAGQYGDWLRENAVSYVALAPAQPLDVFGRTEAAVVGGGPDYLREVWSNQDWRLYRVVDPEPFVAGGTLIKATPAWISFATPEPGLVTLRIVWSEWLTVSGDACLLPAPGGWTEVRATEAGHYVISSGLGGGACG